MTRVPLHAPRHYRIGKSPLREFIDDVRDNADIFIFGLTLGICAGAIASVAFAFVWSSL